MRCVTDRNRFKILIVESHGDTRRALADALEAAGCVAVQSATGADARSRLEGFAYDGMVVDVRLPDADGLDLLDEALTRYPAMRCVVTSGFGSIHHAVRALKRGAVDYLIKPVETTKVAAVLSELAHAAPATAPVATGSKDAAAFRASRLVGSSQAMARVASILERVSPMNSTVLIQGETGTGKELVARTIHENSPRRERPFVAFNAAAIPEGLAEAELFGHAKGAFTDAINTRIGRFELADQGTLFIDELSSMSLALQSKLLRAIQEREIERVGTSQSIKIDVRLITASNTDLRDLVRQGTFREDLFYRLNVVPLTLPPLRERPGDVADLAAHFLAISCRENRVPPKTLSQAALQQLMEFPWPGNVRHLQNAIEHAVALSGMDTVIQRDALPEDVLRPGPRCRALPEPELPVSVPETPDEGIRFSEVMTGIERELIQRYLEKAGGNRRQAARLLNMSRTTLIDKLNRLGLGSGPAAPPDSIRAIA
jgi:DNA-binding NtrC family response regulator